MPPEVPTRTFAALRAMMVDFIARSGEGPGRQAVEAGLVELGEIEAEFAEEQASQAKHMELFDRQAT